MLELLLCSLLTIVPDYLYRRYRAGQAVRQGDHALLGVVRAALGDHRLPDAHRRPDHGDLLQSPVHDQRHAVLPHRADPAGDQSAASPRSSSAYSGRGRQGRADLQARQLEAGGRGGNRAPQDRRDRSRAGGGAGRYRRRPKARSSEAKGALPAGAGRIGDQAGTAPAQSGHRRAARDREAPGPCRQPPGRGRCRHRRETGRRSAALDRASGRKGQRRSRARPGPGGAGQDRRSAPA